MKAKTVDQCKQHGKQHFERLKVKNKIRKTLQDFTIEDLERVEEELGLVLDLPVMYRRSEDAFLERKRKKKEDIEEEKAIEL